MIILVRHPPTKLNETGRIRAQLDPPVPPEGRQVAEATARQFRLVPVDHIYADTTIRTELLGKMIAKVTAAPLTLTPKLASWNLGDFAGKKIDDVAPAIKAYMLKTPGKAVPGGESFETFVRRFVGFMLPFYHSKKTVVFVTHGRPIMTAKAWQEADADDSPMDLAGEDLSPEPDLVAPGGIAIFGPDRPFAVIPDVGDYKDNR